MGGETALPRSSIKVWHRFQSRTNQNERLANAAASAEAMIRPVAW